MQATRRLVHGEGDFPWRTVLVTMGVLVILTANAGYLSLYYHIFGTDQVGQDVFYKSLKSIRTGLVIGTLTTAGHAAVRGAVRHHGRVFPRLVMM